MKKYFILTLTFILTLSCVFSQTNSNVIRETNINSCPTKTQPTNSIYIKGRIYYIPKGPENYAPFATVIIKGTKIGSSADNLGYYSIDITAIADTIKQMTLYCAYLGCVTKEIEIKNKITQTTELDFELQIRPACEFSEIGDGNGNKEKRTHKHK
jgi:hypothetical protein